MVVTRSMDAICKLIDKKFDEFKTSLLQQLTSEIDLYIVEKKSEITSLFDSKKDETALSNEHIESLRKIQEHVSQLQQLHDVLNAKHDLLSDKNDLLSKDL